MKYKLISLFAALLLAGAFFSSCKQEPLSTNGPTLLPMYSSSHPAHPALTWDQMIANSQDHNNLYDNIMVADSDGTNQTSILLGSGRAASVVFFTGLTWSPNGGSIAFKANHYNSTPDTIFTIDVSVNSNGKPIGSNLRKICTGSGATAIAWASTSSTGKIAYTAGSPSKIYTVSSSGGTPSSVYSSFASKALYSLSWNADDSKLAVTRSDSTILILSTSTWAAVDSIKCSGKVGGVDWSRSDTNKLVFHVGSSSSPYERLYYCDPTTASTPLSSGLGYSINPTWSPNNSSVMYLGNSSGNYYIYKVTAYTTSTSQIMSNITFNSSNTLGVKWKR